MTSVQSMIVHQWAAKIASMDAPNREIVRNGLDVLGDAVRAGDEAAMEKAMEQMLNMLMS